MIELPKMFGGRVRPQEDDVIVQLRDAETTRPHRHQPPPPPAHHHHEPRLPPVVRNEMIIAREIFTELLSLDPEARARISQQVEHLLKMYGADDTSPPEGTPV